MVLDKSLTIYFVSMHIFWINLKVHQYWLACINKCKYWSGMFGIEPTFLFQVFYNFIAQYWTNSTSWYLSCFLFICLKLYTCWGELRPIFFYIFFKKNVHVTIINNKWLKGFAASYIFKWNSINILWLKFKKNEENASFSTLNFNFQIIIIMIMSPIANWYLEMLL